LLPRYLEKEENIMNVKLGVDLRGWELDLFWVD
jgi:hypothetical protein